MSVIAKDIKIIDKGSLRATVSVTVAGINIPNFKIIQQDGKAPWVAPPSHEIPMTKAGEKKKYVPLVEVIDGDLKKEIQAAVLAAWRNAMNEQPRETQPTRASIPPMPFVATDEDIPF